MRKRTSASPSRGPLTCNPIGNPAGEKPHGTLMVGMPRASNGTVFRINPVGGIVTVPGITMVVGVKQIDVREHRDDRIAGDDHSAVTLDVGWDRDGRAVEE